MLWVPRHWLRIGFIRLSKGDVYRRICLLVPALLGILVPVYYFGMAETSHLGWDFHAYYAAGRAVLGGEQFVGIHSGIPGVRFVYPPISVLFFLPQALVGDLWPAFLLQTAVSVLATAGLARVTINTIESRQQQLERTDQILIYAFYLGSAPVLAVLGLGQVDMLIALGLALAFLAIEDGSQEVGGILIGLVSLIKVFPALVGLYLLWRRAWRTLGAALLTGLTGLVLGGVLFGVSSYHRYFTVLAARSRLSSFAGSVSPNFFALSLLRPLSQLLPDVSPYLYVPIALSILALPVGLVMIGTRTWTDKVRVYLISLAAILMVSPASNSLYVVYLYFPLLLALYSDMNRAEITLLGLSSVLISLPILPTHVGAFLALIGAPSSVAGPVMQPLRNGLTIASIPLIGLFGILIWGTYHGVHSRGTGHRQETPVSSEQSWINTARTRWLDR